MELVRVYHFVYVGTASTKPKTRTVIEGCRVEMRNVMVNKCPSPGFWCSITNAIKQSLRLIRADRDPALEWSRVAKRDSDILISEKRRRQGGK